MGVPIMLGLYSIYEYLDLERAAEIVRNKLKINFNELDLLRLIFEGQLEASIMFLDEYQLQPIENHKTQTDNEFNIQIKSKVFTGAAILPMIASQEKLIKNLYAQKLNGSKIHFNPSPIAIKLQDSEELYHLYQLDYEFNALKEPLTNLPDTCILCINEKTLRNYISSKLPCSTPSHDTVKPLLLIIGILLYIINNFNSLKVNFSTQERVIHFIEDSFPDIRGLKSRTLSGIFSAANKELESIT